jgi:uncharacterized YigZ family protein
MDNNAGFYYTLLHPQTAEYKDRGSKFIGYVFPVTNLEECKARLEEVQQEHPKATHHCYAYRLGVEGLVYRMNDDGEPSGSAGKSILGQIDRNKLTNILLIVVRYFGGSLLGLPALTLAYKSTAASVLEKVQIVRKSPEATWKLEFPYARLNEVMRMVKAPEITLLQKQIGWKCILYIRLPLSLQNKWLSQLKEIWEVEISASS